MKQQQQDIEVPSAAWDWYKGEQHICFWDKVYICSGDLSDAELRTEHPRGLPKEDTLLFVNSWFGLSNCSSKGKRENAVFQLLEKRRNGNRLSPEERITIRLAQLCDYVEWAPLSNLKPQYHSSYAHMRVNMSSLNLGVEQTSFYREVLRRNKCVTHLLMNKARERGFNRSYTMLHHLLRDDPFLQLDRDNKQSLYLNAAPHLNRFMNTIIDVNNEQNITKAVGNWKKQIQVFGKQLCGKENIHNHLYPTIKRRTQLWKTM